jgi:long-chain acyl-CoA synthetase
MGTMLPGKYSTLEGADAAKRRSCGQTCLLSDTKIVDEKGKELLANEIGEIVMKGPQIMMGYWNLPEQTSEALKDGWLYSGDLGYMDEDGFLYISGRKKDMIKTGGENVFAVEIENIIAEIAGVVECAVFGLPDPKWDEIIAAVIVTRTGMTVTEEEVVRFCREHLAPYKSPRVVHFQTDPLPQSGAGKIQKREIKQSLLARMAVE